MTGAFEVTLGRTGVSARVHDECDAVGEVVEPSMVDELARSVVEVLTGEGIDTATVDVFLVDVDRISELNHSHLGQHEPTDVLSFPLDDPDEAEGFGFVPHLGDIVICPEIAHRQAPDHVGDPRGELLLLAVHATLHLLGHDHAASEDRAVMQSLEARYLGPFGVDHPGDQR